jgi:hypothetical protein
VGSSRVQQGKFQPNKHKKMKSLISSINRSPLRCGFFTVAIGLAWFALSPSLKAVDCPSTCPGGGNTGVGDGALDSVTTGINNTAVGKDALTSTTNGAYNVAIGRSALSANVSGNFNMAIGTEALRDSIANYNLAIGFRTLFQNTSGNHLTGIGAAALRNNTTASFNTAIGSDAMSENSTGEQNTAIGARALSNNTTGDFNTAIGANAGTDPDIASNNVYIGDTGFAGDTNVIAIGGLAASGIPYDNCFIGGIAPQSQVTDGVTVCEVTVRLEDGRLGIDCTHPSNPGSAPDSAPLRRSRPQQPHARPAMPNGTVGQVEKLEETVAEQQKQIATLTAQLKEQAAQFTAQLREQAAQIQKVSAQLELRKPVRRVVANKE